MLRHALSHLARTDPLRWHLANKLTRMQLIQYALDGLAARTYLEIGVDEGQTFCAVRVPSKIGVDPVPPHPAVAAEIQQPGARYFATTSDEFFARDAPSVLAAGVDVVFVDGLHTYDQTFRDISHALPYLTPGGLILVHDCLPVSEAEARPAPTYDEARRLNGPGWNGLWTGDGWKAMVAVRAGLAPGRGWVLNCDHGVGVVYRATGGRQLALTAAEIDRLDYRALIEAPAHLLGLSAPDRLRAVVAALRRERQP